MTFNWGQFQEKYHSHQSLKLAWKLHVYIDISVWFSRIAIWVIWMWRSIAWLDFFIAIYFNDIKIIQVREKSGNFVKKYLHFSQITKKIREFSARSGRNGFISTIHSEKHKFHIRDYVENDTSIVFSSLFPLQSILTALSRFTWLQKALDKVLISSPLTHCSFILLGWEAKPLIFCWIWLSQLYVGTW